MQLSKIKSAFAVFMGISVICMVNSTTVFAKSSLLGKTLTVRASYYGGHDGFDGQVTANCTVFDDTKATMAHRTLRFGTEVVLKNPHTGQTKRVTVTDRGPFIKGRDIDVAIYGVGVPLGVANNTKLEMSIVYVPTEPIMGSACKKETIKRY